jgi:hypothetical protein
VAVPGQHHRHLLLAPRPPRSFPCSCLLCHASPPPPFPLSLDALLSFSVVLSLPPSRKTYSNQSSPPSAAVSCLPQPRRCAEKLRSAALFFSVEGIGPKCRESPPPSPFSPQVPELRRLKFAPDSPPPAKPTSPASSW